MAKVSFAGAKAELLKQLATRLVANGFERKPVGNSIRKTTADGWWALNVAFIDHSTDFDVTLQVLIRVDEVEELVHEQSSLLSERDKRLTATIGSELGNLVDGRQHRWTIKGNADVALAVNSAVAEFEAFGLPFLHRMSDLRVMLDTLSANDASACRLSPIHSARSKTVVALALLIRGKGEASTLAQQQERFLVERGDTGLADFRQFTTRVLAAAS
jgi:hypothetical protein